MATVAMLGRMTRPLMALLLTGAASAAMAAPTVYATRGTFEAAIGTSVTDGYESPGYVFSQSDAVMSAVIGETDYTSTGFSNINVVFSSPTNKVYCAGCNGSFRLTFTSTSVGSASGVYGAGFDYNNTPNFAGTGGSPYVAFVTFGDGTTAEYALSTGAILDTVSFFFGITSDTLITSVHLGLPGGGSTTAGGFLIDNLTIGGAPSAVPLPGTAALLGLALAAGAMVRRRPVA